MQFFTVTLATVRIAATHGSFIPIRQVAPVCTPSRTWIVGPTLVCPQMVSRSVQHFLQDLPFYPTPKSHARQPTGQLQKCPFGKGEVLTPVYMVP